MKIELFKGHITDASGAEQEAWCARSDFGVRAVAVEGPPDVLITAPLGATVSEPVTWVELPGLDRESLEFLLDIILKGGYLARPGVRGKGEAVIFMVVNEALHTMDQVAAWELEDAGSR